MNVINPINLSETEQKILCRILACIMPTGDVNIAGILQQILEKDTEISIDTEQINLNTDGLEGLIGTTNASLSTIIGHVDGIEALIGTTNTKLDTINTSIQNKSLGVATDSVVAYSPRFSSITSASSGTSPVDIPANENRKCAYIQNIGTVTITVFSDAGTTKLAVLKPATTNGAGDGGFFAINNGAYTGRLYVSGAAGFNCIAWEA